MAPMISLVFNDIYVTELGNFTESINVKLSGGLRFFAQMRAALREIKLFLHV